MRILHISTSLSGGAGIAARRICEAQNSNGFNANILGGKILESIEKYESETISEKSLTRKSVSSFVTGVQQKLLQIDDRLVTPISVNTLSKKQKILNRVDLIHIHAFYNMLSMKVIGEISQKIPVVVTLHDQRFFTGGCHYSFQCLGYKSNCKKCPQIRSPFKFIAELSLQNSLSLLKHKSNITYVAPSKWLANCARQSSLLQDKVINVIANPVPSIYHNLQVRKNRSSKIKIGFFSQDVNNPYKGIETLFTAAHFLKDKLPIEIKIFGHGKIRQITDGLIYSQSYFNDNYSAVEAYNSCDVVVVPSKQDNFPSVISEALMCGVPVIGTAVGGIPEILDKFNLPTIEPENPQLLANELLGFAKKERNHELTNIANNIFSYKTSSDSHLQIYNSALVNFKPNSVN